MQILYRKGSIYIYGETSVVSCKETSPCDMSSNFSQSYTRTIKQNTLNMSLYAQ